MTYFTSLISLHQAKPITSDLNYNFQKIYQLLDRDNQQSNLQLSIFPELSLTGYLKRDLFLSRPYLKDVKNKLNLLVEKTANYKQAVVIGSPYFSKNHKVYNSLYLMYGGKIIDIYSKIHLINYGPFDESRYFQAGNTYKIWRINNVNYLFLICSDIIFFNKNQLVQIIQDYKIDMVIVCNASPFEIDKHKARKNNIYKIAHRTNAHFVYLNTVGGEDELVFDGGSFIADAISKNKNTKLYKQMAFFQEESLVYNFQIFNHTPSKKFLEKIKVKLNFNSSSLDKNLEKSHKKNLEAENKSFSFKNDKYNMFKSKLLPLDFSLFNKEQIKSYNAIVIGLRDYFINTGFKYACIALSGGIDSALVATIAIDSLGQERVKFIFMPSHFTSKVSFVNIEKLKTTLGIDVKEVGITDLLEKYTECIPEFKEKLIYKNLQSRIRGNALLSMSNYWENALVLCTVNKSELLTGFSTLGGDILGGFAPIKDLFKSEVYYLSKMRNAFEKRQCNRELIPSSIIDRQPTAELWKDEVDEDELGAYSTIEENFKLETINDFAHNSIAEDRRFYKSEFKKRLTPIGPKISKLSLNGIEYRFPMNHSISSSI